MQHTTGIGADINNAIDDLIALQVAYDGARALYETIKSDEMLALSPNAEIISAALVSKGRGLKAALHHKLWELYSLDALAWPEQPLERPDFRRK